MDYEKAYKDTLAKAREIHRNEDEKRSDMEWLFPELKESEDEMIRKALVRFHKSTIDVDGIKGDDIIAWLEKQDKVDTVSYEVAENEKREFVGYGFLKCKGDFLSFKEGENYWLEYVGKDNYNVRSDNLLGQTFHIKPMELYTVFRPLLWTEKQGEQKPAVTDFNAKDWYVSKVDGKIHDMTYNPADKVESKFKVGDWVIKDCTVAQILDKHKYAFVGLDTNGNEFVCNYGHISSMKHWTIQDAKDGDVLATDNGVCIFNGTLEEGKYPLAYCGITARGFDFYNVDLPFSNDNNIHPATKEQHDLLFQKMREAGYEWNAEKKELKNKVKIRRFKPAYFDNQV